MSLLEYQKKHYENILEILLKNSRALDASETGTGKTYVSSKICKELNLIPFIVCPKSMKNDWLKILNEFGLINKYKQDYIKMLVDFGIEDIETTGGNALTTINFLLEKIFGNDVFFVSDKIFEAAVDKITDAINYYIIQISISAEKFFESIDTKTIITKNGETYKLVGILYDCPNGITHQVTSVCYGDKCINHDPTYIKHTFIDDKKIIMNKELNPSNFKIRADTSLEWGCKNRGINIMCLLYENILVVEQLQKSIDNFLLENSLSYPVVIHGGSKYKNKYLKYKNKYLNLKKDKLNLK